MAIQLVMIFDSFQREEPDPDFVSTKMEEFFNVGSINIAAM